MKSRFARTFNIVMAVHLFVVLAVLFWAGCVSLFRKKPDLIVPVEFVVDVTEPAPNIEDILPPQIEEEDIPVPEPAETPKPKPKPTPRPKIERGRRITRSSDDPSKPKLSKEEIRRLLEAGAKPSDHTSVPDEDARCLFVIREQLHKSWRQPESDAVGDAVAVLFVRLAPNGTVLETGLHKASGNRELDDSVLAAGKAVKSVRGITPGFVRRRPRITVSFRVANE